MSSIMDVFLEYLLEREKLESIFIGLPHSHTTLIKSLISKATFKTGIVENISYYELSLLLTIKSAPGRKGVGTPSKATIRNYIKSIERDFGEHFKVISEGQSLKIFFPDLPQIYSKIFKNTEVNTDVIPLETVAYTEQNNDSLNRITTEVNIELNTASEPVKNIIFNNINNNNNKQSINDNFLPNAKTIARAEALGYSKASDASEIQDFIDFNKAIGSQFADFNPIYLLWLAKGIERQNKKEQLGTTGSINHAKQHSLRTQTHQSSLRERVLKAHAQDFALCEDTEYFDSSQKSEQWNYGAFVVEVN